MSGVTYLSPPNPLPTGFFQIYGSPGNTETSYRLDQINPFITDTTPVLVTMISSSIVGEDATCWIVSTQPTSDNFGSIIVNLASPPQGNLVVSYHVTALSSDTRDAIVTVATLASVVDGISVGSAYSTDNTTYYDSAVNLIVNTKTSWTFNDYLSFYIYENGVLSGTYSTVGGETVGLINYVYKNFTIPYKPKISTAVLTFAVSWAKFKMSDPANSQKLILLSPQALRDTVVGWNLGFYPPLLNGAPGVSVGANVPFVTGFAIVGNNVEVTTNYPSNGFLVKPGVYGNTGVTQATYVFTGQDGHVVKVVKDVALAWKTETNPYATHTTFVELFPLTSFRKAQTYTVYVQLDNPVSLASPLQPFSGQQSRTRGLFLPLSPPPPVAFTAVPSTGLTQSQIVFSWTLSTEPYNLRLETTQLGDTLTYNIPVGSTGITAERVNPGTIYTCTLVALSTNGLSSAPSVQTVAVPPVNDTLNIAITNVLNVGNTVGLPWVVLISIFNPGFNLSGNLQVIVNATITNYPFAPWSGTPPTTENPRVAQVSIPVPPTGQIYDLVATMSSSGGSVSSPTFTVSNPSPPAPPTNLTVSPVTGALNISWTAPTVTTNLSTYEIYVTPYSDYLVNNDSRQIYDSVLPNNTSYTVTNRLVPNTEYIVQVASAGSILDSAYISARVTTLPSPLYIYFYNNGATTTYSVITVSATPAPNWFTNSYTQISNVTFNWESLTTGQRYSLKKNDGDFSKRSADPQGWQFRVLPVGGSPLIPAGEYNVTVTARLGNQNAITSPPFRQTVQYTDLAPVITIDSVLPRGAPTTSLEILTTGVSGPGAVITNIVGHFTSEGNEFLVPGGFAIGGTFSFNTLVATTLPPPGTYNLFITCNSSGGFAVSTTASVLILGPGLVRILSYSYNTGGDLLLPTNSYVVSPTGNYTVRFIVDNTTTTYYKTSTEIVTSAPSASTGYKVAKLDLPGGGLYALTLGYGTGSGFVPLTNVLISVTVPP